LFTLTAKTIIPDETVFQDVDWIIGNHADELAPWIPIIASRSKPLTRLVKKKNGGDFSDHVKETPILIHSLSFSFSGSSSFLAVSMDSVAVDTSFQKALQMESTKPTRTISATLSTFAIMNCRRRF